MTASKQIFCSCFSQRNRGVVSISHFQYKSVTEVTTSLRRNYICRWSLSRENEVNTHTPGHDSQLRNCRIDKLLVAFVKHPSGKFVVEYPKCRHPIGRIITDFILILQQIFTLVFRQHPSPCIHFSNKSLQYLPRFFLRRYPSMSIFSSIQMWEPRKRIIILSHLWVY